LLLLGLSVLALGIALARRTAGVSTVFGVNSAGSLAQTSLRVAPEFTLELYDGTPLEMAKLRGEPVVLNFWASWCIPCREEMPVLARASHEYGSVRFVGVGIWDAESDAKSFLSQTGVTYPSGADIGGRIAIDYGLTGVPETYFVRADGTVSRRWVGPLGEDQLRSFVEEIRQ
jgi:cytochrome c biogenesis protein CcmG/thiol:disulfide interchange protein DsbE